MPTEVDPVKAILLINGWETIAAPTSFPKPGTIFTTPSGIPESINIYPSFRADKDVFSAGLRTVVHPVANIGASLNAAIRIGKFQGII